MRETVASLSSGVWSRSRNLLSSLKGVLTVVGRINVNSGGLFALKRRSCSTFANCLLKYLLRNLALKIYCCLALLKINLGTLFSLCSTAASLRMRFTMFTGRRGRKLMVEIVAVLLWSKIWKSISIFFLHSEKN